MKKLHRYLAVLMVTSGQMATNVPSLPAGLLGDEILALRSGIRP
jgi:hypothetical protein